MNAAIGIKNKDIINAVDKLKKLLDYYFSYEVKGKEWIPAYVDGIWDGKKKFLKYNSLPYPFIHKIQELISSFNSKFGTSYHLNIIDKRNMNVVKAKYNTKFKKSSLIPRKYQEEALQKILDKKIGISFLPTACVDCDTELLTPFGWKFISEYKKGDKVMQYDKNTQSGNSIEPLEFIKQKSKGFYHLKTKYGLNQKLTPNHRVLFLDYKGRHKDILMDDLVIKHNKNKFGFNGKFISSFNKIDGVKKFNDFNKIKLITYIIADGNIVNGKKIKSTKISKFIESLS